MYCLLSAGGGGGGGGGGEGLKLFRFIPYRRFVIEFKGVRNIFLEISVIYNDISLYFGDVIVVI